MTPELNPPQPRNGNKKADERAALALYKAVSKYVKHHRGEVVVAGGIQIQEWPGDGKSNFSVAIKCTGRKPTYASHENPSDL